MSKKTMTDFGYDELRIAIIRQALEDVENGLLSEQFITNDVIERLKEEKTQESASEYLREAIRHKTTADKFLLTEWCRMLGGALDISALWRQVIENARSKAEKLNRPVKLYTGKKSNRVFVKKYKRLYDMQINITNIVSPTYFMNKLQDNNNFEFESNKKYYYVEVL